MTEAAKIIAIRDTAMKQRPPKKPLGAKQLAWLRANVAPFADAEKRAQQAIAETAATKRELKLT